MLNRFDPEEFRPLVPLERLVRRSRLIGAEEALVLWGGGNTSSKMEETDPWGRTRRVLRIKGSGADLKAVSARNFSGLYLDLLEPLMTRAALPDAEMVEFIQRCFVEPGAGRPSIETLLHAFVPQACVDHTHADACLAITNTPNGLALAHEVWGDGFIWIPYQRPGFALSKAVGEAVRANPKATAVVLDNHGLITFGVDDAESYGRHIEYISRAEEFLEKKRASVVVPADPAVQQASVPTAVTATTRASAKTDMTVHLPRLRGALSRTASQLLSFMPLGADPLLDELLAHPELASFIAAGPATPDHTLHVRGKFCLVTLPAGQNGEAAWNALQSALEKFQADYADYFNRFQDGSQGVCNSEPRLILVPGVGVVAAGPNARACRIGLDIARHWAWIVLHAAAAGGYRSLSENDKFSVEYWPLELYKLSLAPPEKELARKVFLVTGAASGIGRAIARLFFAEGACLALVDRDMEGLASLVTELGDPDRIISLPADVTDAAAVQHAFKATARKFGGLDGVASNAGIARGGAIEDLPDDEWHRSFAVNSDAHFFVTREALRLFRAQGMGGNLIYMVTKNVFAPGKEFAAYSASKAAEMQLARVAALEGAPLGVRANMINPDAIFEGSKLWDEIKPQRAAAHGVDETGLEDFYAGRNLLKVKVSAEDVAQAALYLASRRSAKTTGCVITVDGGLPEAFPR